MAEPGHSTLEKQDEVGRSVIAQLESVDNDGTYLLDEQLWSIKYRILIKPSQLPGDKLRAREKEGVETMPPHCDSMDGPVVKAAIKALDSGDVTAILPFVPEEGEAEVKKAFERVMKVRAHGPEAKEVADRHFFETVVRIHRAGEGAPFTGLKPAGLGHGPVVPVAEKAIEEGSAEDLVKLLTDTVAEQLRERFERVMRHKREAAEGGGVKQMREYVEAMLGLEVYSHKLYECAHLGPHGEGAHGHEHVA